ncbi:MAG: metal-dependent transcriptional regulator [Methanomicrobiales archaeon]|nr:metal-dependent transcriptional regulator [Methanomicrobiales archaeon]
MMNTGKKEDLLEAIYLLTERGATSLLVSRLTQHLDIPPREAMMLSNVLVDEGSLIAGPGDEIRLSATGILIAERVVKKHQILEHFFVEMLGVHPDEASEEACRLEHHVSDELTRRLSRLIDRSPDLRESSPENEVNDGMSLLDFREGDLLVIRKVEYPGHLHRLMDLGFLPGEKISVRRKLKNRAVVVAVKGCDIALSPDVAALVKVVKDI